MCAICDGATYDEMLAGLHGVVQRFGWAVQGVEASTPWTYTIGLTERFGHPELVLAGIDISLAMNILNALADRVAGGEQLRPGGPRSGGRRVGKEGVSACRSRCAPNL